MRGRDVFRAQVFPRRQPYASRLARRQLRDNLVTAVLVGAGAYLILSLLILALGGTQ